MENSEISNEEMIERIKKTTGGNTERWWLALNAFGGFETLLTVPLSMVGEQARIMDLLEILTEKCSLSNEEVDGEVILFGPKNETGCTLDNTPLMDHLLLDHWLAEQGLEGIAREYLDIK